MKRFEAIFLLLVLGACSQPGASPDDPTGTDPGASRPAPVLVRESEYDPTMTRVGELAQTLIDREYAPGLAIGVVRGDESKIRTFGMAQPREGMRVTPDTVFEIGSTTKTFTGLLLAERVVSGDLELEMPVQKLLPDGWKIPGRKDAPVTLRSLATHTSGLPRLPFNLKPAEPRDPYADYDATKLRAFLGGTPLQTTPGEQYAYSNVGMGLLGYALAANEDAAYSDVLENHVLGPLALTETSVTLDREARDEFAQGHDADGEPVPPWTFPTLQGAGSLRSTVGDMTRFLKANMHPPEGPLGSAIQLTHETHASRPGGGVGLGWHVGLPDPDGADVRWHNGQTGGFHSFIAFDPEKNVGVVVLANAATMIVDELGRAVLQLVSGGEAVLQIPPVVEISDETLEKYTGKYQVTPQFELTITRKQGHLYAQATGQPRLRLYPVTQTEFQYRAVHASVMFQIDDDGNVTGLILHQAGKKTPATRK